MEACLSQVRALALRAATPNGILLAALESLSDSAAAHGHEEAETYRMVLKACKECEGDGPVHGLINKLIGSELAKKISTSMEGWRKTLRKEERKAPRSQAHQPQHSQPGLFPHVGHNFYPPTPPPAWMSFRGRPRGGRPRGGPSRPRACYLCKSTDHILADCPGVRK